HGPGGGAVRRGAAQPADPDEAGRGGELRRGDQRRGAAWGEVQLRHDRAGGPGPHRAGARGPPGAARPGRGAGQLSAGGTRVTDAVPAASPLAAGQAARLGALVERPRTAPGSGPPRAAVAVQPEGGPARVEQRGPRVAKVVAVASGKGGVGKTNIAVN